MWAVAVCTMIILPRSSKSPLITARPCASASMGVHWTGIVLGLGFVIIFGYWTTDFLVVQRVLSAHNLRAARMAPSVVSDRARMPSSRTPA